MLYMVDIKNLNFMSQVRIYLEIFVFDIIIWYDYVIVLT